MVVTIAMLPPLLSVGFAASGFNTLAFTGSMEGMVKVWQWEGGKGVVQQGTSWRSDQAQGREHSDNHPCGSGGGCCVHSLFERVVSRRREETP